MLQSVWMLSFDGSTQWALLSSSTALHLLRVTVIATVFAVSISLLPPPRSLSLSFSLCVFHCTPTWCQTSCVVVCINISTEHVTIIQLQIDIDWWVMITVDVSLFQEPGLYSAHVTLRSLMLLRATVRQWSLYVCFTTRRLNTHKCFNCMHEHKCIVRCRSGCIIVSLRVQCTMLLPWDKLKNSSVEEKSI